jgi:hypothetical protein
MIFRSSFRLLARLHSEASHLAFVSGEVAVLVVSERLRDLFFGVHDERAMPHNGLLQLLAREKQELHPACAARKLQRLPGACEAASVHPLSIVSCAAQMHARVAQTAHARAS